MKNKETLSTWNVYSTNDKYMFNIIAYNENDAITRTKVKFPSKAEQINSAKLAWDGKPQEIGLIFTV